jgi:hypothetical protein
VYDEIYSNLCRNRLKDYVEYAWKAWKGLFAGVIRRGPFGGDHLGGPFGGEAGEKYLIKGDGTEHEEAGVSNVDK